MSGHFFAYLSLCQSRSWWPIILKLGGWCKGMSAYNLYISDFSYWWPKVRSILRPCHYKAMGEKPNPSLTHQARLFYHKLSYVRVLLMIQVQILIGDLHRVTWGHMTSSEVTNRFWLITNDWKELQAWAWSHCACIVKTNRLICNMSHLGQHLTSGDLDLRSNIDLTLLRSPCIWFDAPWREEHAGNQIKSLAFLVQKLFAKNVLCKKQVIWGLLIPSAQTVDGSSNLMTCWRKNSSRAIECFFPGPSN